MFMNNLIIDFYNGRIKLWKSFWIVGEFVYGGFTILILQIDKNFFTNTNESKKEISIFFLNNLSFIPKLLLVMTSIFVTIGVWRAAENYRGSILIILLVFIYYGYRISSLVLLF